nr:MAG TPA: hypothetical protein [Bacteriophage sp.]
MHRQAAAVPGVRFPGLLLPGFREKFRMWRNEV